MAEEFAARQTCPGMWMPSALALELGIRTRQKSYLLSRSKLEGDLSDCTSRHLASPGSRRRLLASKSPSLPSRLRSLCAEQVYLSQVEPAVSTSRCAQQPRSSETLRRTQGRAHTTPTTNGGN